MAVVTSLRQLDRETAPTRLLPLVVGDARGLTTTTTVTVTITDVNDNPMRPGAKVVSVTRIAVRTFCSLGLCYCSLLLISSLYRLSFLQFISVFHSLPPVFSRC